MAQELHVALELISSALDLEGAAWENYIHHPAMWSEGGVERSGPSKSQKQGLEALRAMKRSPSELVEHFCKQPRFFGRELPGQNGSQPKSDKANHADIAASAHVATTKKIISEGINDELMPERVKKPREEATSGELEQFEKGKKDAKRAKRRENKRAKKDKDKMDAEMASRDDEYVSAGK